MKTIWHPRALSIFYKLPVHSATLLDRAVVSFAETGRGELYWDPPEHVLRAGFHYVALAIDEQAGTIYVLRVRRVS